METGIRIGLYHCGSFNYLAPQPRLALTWHFAPRFYCRMSAWHAVRFDRLIEESATGLPTDFWTCCDRGLRPESTSGVDAGLGIAMPAIGVDLLAEGYLKRLRRVTEYRGSLLDLTNPGYNPLDDVMPGYGYSVGASLSALYQSRSIRIRASYTLSRTRLRFADLGNHYYPSAHHRPHSLNATVSAGPFGALTLAASYNFASGTPYTAAKYGYIIDDNLIMEYYPHNSSHLPAYSRLDLSATWKFRRTRHGLNQEITLSIYNALASRNVLFRYTSYSLTQGVEARESVMKSVIPSITYTVKF